MKEDIILQELQKLLPGCQPNCPTCFSFISGLVQHVRQGDHIPQTIVKNEDPEEVLGNYLTSDPQGEDVEEPHIPVPCATAITPFLNPSSSFVTHTFDSNFVLEDKFIIIAPTGVGVDQEMEDTEIMDPLMKTLPNPITKSLSTEENRPNEMVKTPEESETQTFPCGKCRLEFDNDRTRNQHVRQDHSSSDKYICFVCNKFFKSRRSCRQHNKIHTGEVQPAQCHLCHRIYPSSLALERHLKIHNRVQNPIPRIPNLGRNLGFQMEEFENSTNLTQIDFRREDDFGSRMNQDSSSMENQEGKEMLKRKTPEVSSETQLFPCGKCRLEFDNDYTRNQHVRLDHSSTDKYICFVCNKSFRSRSYWSEHSKIHTGEVQPAQCHLCHKIYPSPLALERHLKLHTRDQNPIPRSLNLGADPEPEMEKIEIPPAPTQIEFRTEEEEDNIKIEEFDPGLNQESSNMEEDDDDQFFKNGFSENSIKGEAKMEEKEPLFQEWNPNGGFPCGKCPKVFQKENERNSHLRQTHRLDDKYKCFVCGKSYQFRRNWWHHNKRNHSLKGHLTCEHCGKILPCQSALNKHTKTHTKVPLTNRLDGKIE